MAKTIAYVKINGLSSTSIWNFRWNEEAFDLNNLKMNMPWQLNLNQINMDETPYLTDLIEVLLAVRSSETSSFSLYKKGMYMIQEFSRKKYRKIK